MVVFLHIFMTSDQLKTFLTEYSKINEKISQLTYAQQLTRIAHREQVALVIDLDHVQDFDDELAQMIASSTRRYVNILLDVSVKYILPKDY